MYEWFIGQRYLRAKHKHGFISLISLISVAGITVGVTALIVVLAVYSGFTNGLRDQIIGINSHIIVQKIGSGIEDYNLLRERILTVNKVTGATPYLYSQTLISSSGGGNGIVLRGIDPDTAASVISLPDQMIVGELEDLKSEENSRIPHIILGKNNLPSTAIFAGHIINPHPESQALISRYNTFALSITNIIMEYSQNFNAKG